METEIPLITVVALLNDLFDFIKNMIPIIANPLYGINKYRCLEISESANSEPLIIS